MADMVYNGVSLPALPYWDEEIYPYVAIMYASINGETVAHLVVSSKPILVDYLSSDATTPSAYIPGGSTYEMCAVYSGLSESQLESYESIFGSMQGIQYGWPAWSDVKTSSSKTWMLLPPIWANHDIELPDGTVYIAASEPTGVMGWTLTSSGDGFVLYGDKKAPVLPTYDPVAYPYAVMGVLDGGLLDPSLAGQRAWGCVASSVEGYMQGITYEITDPCNVIEGLYFETQELADMFAMAMGASAIPVGEWDIYESSPNPDDNSSYGCLVGDVVISSYEVVNSDDEVIEVPSDIFPLEGMDIVEWNGEVGGLPTFNDGDNNYYKVSDAIPTIEQIENGLVSLSFSKDDVLGTTAEISSMLTSGEMSVMESPEEGIIALTFPDGYLLGVVLESSPLVKYGIAPAGTYFARMELVQGVFMYVSALAYPVSSSDEPDEPDIPEPLYDKVALLSGLTAGLISNGTPEIEANDAFTRGYLAGAELTAKRNIS